MNPPPSDPPSRAVSPCKLLSILLLTTAMLLASTVTLKASWLWVLAPVALLVLWEDRMEHGAGSREKGAVSGWWFYAGLLGVAMAFHVFGLSSTGGHTVAASGCGSGGCGSAGGCGTGGCGASSGGACSCGGGKTSKTVANTSKSSFPTAPTRPVTTAPPNRNLNVQLPPLPPRAPGSSLPTANRSVRVTPAGEGVRAPLLPVKPAPPAGIGATPSPPVVPPQGQGK